jgi:hypothetical protein
MILTRIRDIETECRQNLDLRKTVIKDLTSMVDRLNHPGYTTPIGENERQQLTTVVSILDEAIDKLSKI